MSTDEKVVDLGDLRPAVNPVSLSDLTVAGEAIRGAVPTVTGVTVDSADARTGDLFVAVPGERTHGARYAEQAIAGGAVAIATDEAGAELLDDGSVPVLITANPRHRAGEMAALVYGYPARSLLTTAVTGTNGKTTTSYMAAAALSATSGGMGVLNSIEFRIPGLTAYSPRTTLEAPLVHRLLAVTLERGVGGLSLEASSHGLVLGRFAGVQVDVAGFTNLQHDHLDFHGDMETYLRDKAALFTPAHAKRGVICVDDEWARRLVDLSEIPVITVNTRGSDTPADWTVSNVHLGGGEQPTSYMLSHIDGTSIEITCPIPGQVNVSNSALAFLMAVSAGADPEAARQGIAQTQPVPGRMQQVSARGRGRPLAIVDYAHTPEALDLVLESLRAVTPGRIIAVFGSDGDRDKLKRPELGEVGARRADLLVITDENPRSEDPATIRAEVIAGIRSGSNSAELIEDTVSRAHAIAHAVELATEDDTIIITGKGHERTQEIAGVHYPYNDVPVLSDAIVARWGEL